MPPDAFTDCRSLSDHLCNAGGGEVADKRLAIDLTGLRQEVWRALGEEIGNPAYAEKIPDSAPTRVKWVATATMVTDGLTKAMKAPQMDLLMSHGSLKVDFTP